MKPCEEVTEEIKTFDYPPKKSSFLKLFRKGLSSLCNGNVVEPAANNTDTVQVPFKIMYAKMSQYRFQGPFTGNQCTSMSLAALSWWQKKGDCGSFTPKDVNLVLRAGDKLHTVLRKDYHLSAVEDGRIAIDDLPKQLEIGLYGSYSHLSRAEDDEFILTSPVENVDAFTTLQSYLTTRLKAGKKKPEGYLLTIGETSNAIMYTKQGTWQWFDSHGHMRVSNTTCKDRGAVVELESLEHLIMFIIALRGPERIGQIVPITCVDAGTNADVSPAPAAPSATVAGNQLRESGLGVGSVGSGRKNGVTKTVYPPYSLFGDLSNKVKLTCGMSEAKSAPSGMYESVSPSGDIPPRDRNTNMSTSPVIPDYDEDYLSLFVSFIGGFGSED